VANLGGGKEEIIRHHQVPDEKIEVLYNGLTWRLTIPATRSIPRKQKEGAGIPPEGFVVLFLAPASAQGLDSLMTAFARFSRKFPRVFYS